MFKKTNFLLLKSLLLIYKNYFIFLYYYNLIYVYVYEYLFKHFIFFYKLCNKKNLIFINLNLIPFFYIINNKKIYNIYNFFINKFYKIYVVSHKLSYFHIYSRLIKFIIYV